MKKVLLLGDCIRVQCQERVKELLADECEVLYPSFDYGYTLSLLWFLRLQFNENQDWAEPDLIYWNTGIMDHHRPVDDGEPLIPAEMFLHLLRRLHRQLAFYSGRLVWASTTPAGEKYVYDPQGNYGVDRETWNKEIALYNRLAAAYLTEKDVMIHDLYALIAKNPQYSGDDGIHLSPEGVEAAAQEIAACIRLRLDQPAAQRESDEQGDAAAEVQWY